MVASPVAGAAAGAEAPLVLTAGATALGSKYSLISASSSSTVLGLGRPARALRPPRPAALVAPPAAALTGLGAAAAVLGLLFSFFVLGALMMIRRTLGSQTCSQLTGCGHQETWVQQEWVRTWHRG
jgi:hypothetical protein